MARRAASTVEEAVCAREPMTALRFYCGPFAQRQSFGAHNKPKAVRPFLLVIIIFAALSRSRSRCRRCRRGELLLNSDPLAIVAAARLHGFSRVLLALLHCKSGCALSIREQKY